MKSKEPEKGGGLREVEKFISDSPFFISKILHDREG